MKRTEKSSLHSIANDPLVPCPKLEPLLELRLLLPLEACLTSILLRVLLDMDRQSALTVDSPALYLVPGGDLFSLILQIHPHILLLTRASLVLPCSQRAYHLLLGSELLPNTNDPPVYQRSRMMINVDLNKITSLTWLQFPPALEPLRGHKLKVNGLVKAQALPWLQLCQGTLLR